MTQTDFAALAGATRQSQSNYEKGDRAPDTDYLAAIAAAGADVLYILTGQRAGESQGTQGAGALSQRDRVWLELGRALPDGERTRLQEIGSALADAARVRGKTRRTTG